MSPTSYQAAPPRSQIIRDLQFFYNTSPTSNQTGPPAKAYFATRRSYVIDVTLRSKSAGSVAQVPWAASLTPSPSVACTPSFVVSFRQRVDRKARVQSGRASAGDSANQRSATS
jgi:hypothetical protein